MDDVHICGCIIFFLWPEWRFIVVFLFLMIYEITLVCQLKLSFLLKGQWVAVYAIPDRYFVCVMGLHISEILQKPLSIFICTSCEIPNFNFENIIPYTTTSIHPSYDFPAVAFFRFPLSPNIPPPFASNFCEPSKKRTTPFKKNKKKKWLYEKSCRHTCQTSPRAHAAFHIDDARRDATLSSVREKGWWMNMNCKYSWRDYARKLLMPVYIHANVYTCVQRGKIELAVSRGWWRRLMSDGFVCIVWEFW